VFTFSDPPFEPQPSVLPVVKLLKIKHCVYIFRDPPFEPQPSVLAVVKLLKIKHCVYIFRVEYNIYIITIYNVCMR
jgi:16S rRNA G966 N2-methylase RsmD